MPGFRRVPGLGTHHEQGFAGVQVLRGLLKIRPIHVGHETDPQRLGGVMLKRGTCHFHADGRPANTHVDDIPDGPARAAQAGARAQGVGQPRHAVQRALHQGPHILAIDLHTRPRRPAQRHVHGRPAFAGVDGVALEHGIDTSRQAALPGQCQQQVNRLGGDTVLGVVQIPTRRVQRQPFAPRGVFQEQVAQTPGRQ
ncbi:hypothetical protein D3C72_1035520 [compost metagenome]